MYLIIKIKNLSNCVYGKNLILLNERMCYNMGSRGAFQDVDTGKFNFVENGQNYHTVGDVDGVQVILQNIANSRIFCVAGYKISE